MTATSIIFSYFLFFVASDVSVSSLHHNTFFKKFFVCSIRVRNYLLICGATLAFMYYDCAMVFIIKLEWITIFEYNYSLLLKLIIILNTSLCGMSFHTTILYFITSDILLKHGTRNIKFSFYIAVHNFIQDCLIMINNTYLMWW